MRYWTNSRFHGDTRSPCNNKSFLQKSKTRLASNANAEASTAVSAEGHFKVTSQPKANRSVMAKNPMSASRLNHDNPWHSAVAKEPHKLKSVHKRATSIKF